MITRRHFVKWSAAAGAWVYVGGLAGCVDKGTGAPQAAVTPPEPLDPSSIPQFVSPLLIPPVMPRASQLSEPKWGTVDYYEISVKQFAQQVLPDALPETTVWGYGPVSAMDSRVSLMHNAPSFTIEAKAGRPTRIKWINDLRGESGALPHLLPVDPTLHWANPMGGVAGRDTRPVFDRTPDRYVGPVPLVTHVHGAVGVGDESDGYPEAWFLPADDSIPADFAREGTWYDFFADKAKELFGVDWGPGYAVFQYPNENRASTLWYHDHALGITRLNVYAGPAGFYIVRGGRDADHVIRDKRTKKPANLPGPAPVEGDSGVTPYREIPIAIQDRAFNDDGSLFYPDSRDFFDGITGPFVPEPGGYAPIWNPEFFGNTLIANGKTWPFLEVEQVRYRLRLLNGCQSRFLILDFSQIPGISVWQIGNEGGLLAQPVDLSVAENRLLMGPAERADIIVDFAKVPTGEHVLGNLGPDEPFGGGVPGSDFDPADPATTGRVLQFRVVAATEKDPSTPPQFLQMPRLRRKKKVAVTRKLALIEEMGMGEGSEGEELEGPRAAMLGIVDAGQPKPLEWAAPVTENPQARDTEIWEFYNTTADAHPMHIHETVFEVLDRRPLKMDGEDLAIPLTPVGSARSAEPWERGFKDTVIAYPGEVTRVRARFTKEGQYVWHCHIVEHEDNEMMRPYRIGLEQPGQPQPKPMEGGGGDDDM